MGLPFDPLLAAEAIVPYIMSLIAATMCGFSIGWLLCNSISNEIVEKRPGKLGMVHFLGKHYSGENSKMVICLRADLNLSFNKAAVQVGHACVGMFKNLATQQVGLIDNWEDCGQPKVCVRIEDENQLNHMRDTARAQGLATFIVRDVGEVRTVLAILGPNSVVDKVTKGLKLYE